MEPKFANILLFAAGNQQPCTHWDMVCELQICRARAAFVDVQALPPAQMHISIPDAAVMEETEAGKAGKFVTYNIHIDGVFHGSVRACRGVRALSVQARFSALRELHAKLKMQFGAGSVSDFPPKARSTCMSHHCTGTASSPCAPAPSHIHPSSFPRLHAPPHDVTAHRH